MPDVNINIRANSRGFRREAKRVRREARDLERQLGGIAHNFGRAVLSQLSGRFSAFSTVLTGTSLALGGVVVSMTALLGAAARASDEMVLATNALRSASIAAQGIDIRIGQIARAAAATRSEFQSMAQLTARIAQNVVGISFTDTLVAATTISQAFRIAGATQQEASGATRQFIQGLASGTLRGQELVSVLEQAPQIAQLIADHLGVARGELRGLAEQGLLTNDVVLPAILNGAEKLQAIFEQLEPTWSDAWTVFTDGASRGLAWLLRNSQQANALKRVLLEGGRAATSFFTNDVQARIEDLNRREQALLNVIANPPTRGGVPLELNYDNLLNEIRLERALLQEEVRAADAADAARVGGQLQAQARQRLDASIAEGREEARQEFVKTFEEAGEEALSQSRRLADGVDEIGASERRLAEELAKIQKARELGAITERQASIDEANARQLHAERIAKIAERRQRDAEQLLSGSVDLQAILAETAAGEDALAQAALVLERRFADIDRRVAEGLSQDQAALDRQTAQRIHDIEVARIQAAAAEDARTKQERYVDSIKSQLAALDPVIAATQKYELALATIDAAVAEGLDIDAEKLRRLAKEQFDKSVGVTQPALSDYVDGITETLTDALARGADSSDIGRIFAAKIIANLIKQIDAGQFSLGGLFEFHRGGIVPGAPGTEVLARLEAGEVVIPANASLEGGSGTVVNLETVLIGDVDRATIAAVGLNADTIAATLSDALQRQGFLRG